ncbi:MAG: Eco57I restriction-modification methylase domain-containing protein [Atopobiaceae bacterium]|nr:Eco57I restriction-modification methylase domain-containing protein [Atopobiaceae bacterium]MBR3315460.1 Eco57I restriction-modification methylase domain-containing protein [Atopobiaceae bacterium]
MTEAFEQAIRTRIKAISDTPEARRQALAQHLTPPEVAELAASLFSDADRALDCLDLGGGTGILSVALLERYGEQVERIDTVELDPTLARVYDEELRERVGGKTILGDALIAGVNGGTRYDRIILNPPYKKMASNDPRQSCLPAHSANLYSAFIMRGVEQLRDGGELVAIVPRSWTNGDYFTPFRRFVLSQCSLDMLHIYGSRDEVFSDTNVLQETMIVRFSKRRQVGKIRVSESVVKGATLVVREYEARDLIVGDKLVVRISPEESTSLGETVESVGLCPSTGKVVDFRSRGYITQEKPKERPSVPLIYVGNFPKGQLQHPLSFGKGQWFCLDDEWATKQVCDPGAYVLVKRFSAKEERRRVVAYPLVVDAPVALENHSSFLHQGRPRRVVPLRSADLAYGLSLWLNSTFIDEWFRGVSGSTQVNAGDIKKMPCPSLDDLESLGQKWSVGMDQKVIDEVCGVLI